MSYRRQWNQANVVMSAVSDKDLEKQFDEAQDIIWWLLKTWNKIFVVSCLIAVTPALNIENIEDGVCRAKKERFLETWNTIILVSCVFAVLLDPLFIFMFVVNEEKKCVRMDKKLNTTANVLRSVTDIIYIIHIILQFRTWAMAKRYLSPYFLINILAVLPLPLVLASIMVSKLIGPVSLDLKNFLKFVVLCQYVPRILRIYLTWKELKRTGSKLVKTVWVRAAFNFSVYILASHVVGAFWYHGSIQREIDCWGVACKNHIGYVPNFYCDDKSGDHSFLNDFCPVKTPNTTLFDFGIFLNALQSRILESTDFPSKLSQCFCWGLRNLSSFGSNLQTSSCFWENFFAICITIAGILLFLYLIGNMQTFMQLSTTRSLEQIARSEEVRMKMKLKERDIQPWISNNGLPDNIKKAIMQHVQQRLEENGDVDVENLLPILPVELRNDIKRHLCLAMLKKVPMLRNISEQLLLMICNYLKVVHYSEHNNIVREGEPLDVLLFITKGIAWSYRTQPSGSLRVDCLEKGHFYGKELLVWGFEASPLPNLTELPISTTTVKSHTKVEGFALMANDLKTIVSWWHRSKEPELAASVVQAAWRHHQQKMLLKMSAQPNGNWNSPRAVCSWCFKE